MRQHLYMRTASSQNLLYLTFQVAGKIIQGYLLSLKLFDIILIWVISFIGFLAFREIEPCLSLYEKLTINNPELIPQVIIFDGNGILHPQKFGLASHFGVLQNVCTIGAAKNLYQMNEILNNEEHKSKILQLQKPGDHFFIGGTSAIDSLGAVRCDLLIPHIN